MGIDTGSSIAYNSHFPVPGVNQSSATYRNNFAIIKQAIERLQTVGSSATSLFSVTTEQRDDGQLQFVVALKNNTFALPVGEPMASPKTGSVRLSAGNIEFHNGSAWIKVANENPASIAAALGFVPAPINSPSFLGLPTAPTAAPDTNTNQVATTAYVRSAITNMIGAAPGALASLAALAKALNDDPNFAAHLTTELANKAPINHTHTEYLKTITTANGTFSGNSLLLNGNNGITANVSGNTLTLGLDPATAHGNIGGGTYHAVAIPNGAAGFMSGADKAKLDSLSGNGFAYSRFVISNASGLHVNDAPSANSSFVFSSDPAIVLTNTGNELHFGFSPTNESHGFRGGGQLHAIAVPNGDAGFLSGPDKAKLDALTTVNASSLYKGYMSPADKTKLDSLVVQPNGGYTTIEVNGQIKQITGDNVLKFEGVNGLDVDYKEGTNTLYLVLNKIGVTPLGDFTLLKENFNSSNDRNPDPIDPPIILADGTAIDHTISTNGSANISFEWAWTGAETDIDGFYIYLRASKTGEVYTFGSDPASEQVMAVPAQKRSIFVLGVSPDQYYSFAVQAYRIVQKDVDANGVIYSTVALPSATGERPYRPAANVAFAGDVTGTIDGTAATIVKANATDAWSKFSGVGDTLPAGNVEFNFANSNSKGGNAKNTDAVGSRSASEVSTATLNFNARNDRNASPIAAPIVVTDGEAIDHTINPDGSANISFEWTWIGDNADIDGFIVYARQATNGNAYTLGQSPAEEMVYYVTPEKRAILLYGVPSTQWYTLYVQAYRIVDNDVSASGFIRSPAVKSIRSEENPYRPSATASFSGNITGTIGGKDAATVANNATNAWDKFSGTNNTLPAGNVEFNFAGSDSKGGSANNTLAVGNQSAETIQNSSINFNKRNDRNGTAIPAIVIPNDQSAIDHTVNTDGSVNLSFEWQWSGQSVDIDGFIVTVRQGDTAAAYTAGSSPQDESVWYITPEKRAVYLYGVPANKYYTFFVEAYRVVDTDVSATGFIKTIKYKSTATGEDPYLPMTEVAFAGNLSGTINGVSAATVQTAAQSAWAKFSGVGNTIPAGNVEFNFAASGAKGGSALNTASVGNQSATTVQNAVINFNTRNDRSATAIIDPVVVVDGTSVDHVINTNGSADISFEWTWGGAIGDIDGFIVFTYASKSNTPYTFGSNVSGEMVNYVTPEKRAFILYGIAPDLYYTFYVQAYRIVDVDVNSNGIIKSNPVKSLRGEENPYQPATAPVFAGDITGTINGTSVTTIIDDVNDLKGRVSGADLAAAAYSLVKNPIFTAYTNASSVPDLWTSDTIGSVTRVLGVTSTYAARVTSGVNQMGYFAQKAGSVASPIVNIGQYFVVETFVKLVSGTFTGAGAMLRIMNTSDGIGEDLFLNFKTDPDSTGAAIGDGIAGKTYTFTKLFKATAPNPAYLTLYAMGHYGSLGSIASSNTIDFLRLTVRPASKSEIDTNTAAQTVDALKSTVGTYSGIISDLQGKTSAYMKLATTSGTNAEAFVKIETASGPNTTTSAVSIGAQEFMVLNRDTNGYQKALSVSNGNVQIYGELQAKSIKTEMLQVGSITTDTIASQAVTKSGLATNPSLVAGNGLGSRFSYYNPSTGEVISTASNAQTICSYVIELDQPSNMYVIVNAKQDYLRGTANWVGYIYIDGSPVATTGGGNGYTDCVVLSTAAINIASGTHTIEFKWACEASNVRIKGTTMFVHSTKR